MITFQIIKRLPSTWQVLNIVLGSSLCGSAETNPTSNHEDAGLIPGLVLGIQRATHGLDPALLWLWLWPTAVAPIGPLAWEPPYAKGLALKSEKKKVLVS